MDPEHPVPGRRRRAHARRARPPEAIDALVAVAGAGSRFPLLSVEVRQLGGELGRPTARARRARGRSTPATRCTRSGSTPTPELDGAGRGADRGRQGGARPVDRRAHVPQLRRHAARPGDASGPSRPTTASAASRQAVDPADLIRSNHPVRLSSARPGAFSGRSAPRGGRPLPGAARESETPRTEPRRVGGYAVVARP